MNYTKLDDLNGNGCSYSAVDDDGTMHIITRADRPLSYALNSCKPQPGDMFAIGTPISREEFERVRADAKAWLERL